MDTKLLIWKFGCKVNSLSSWFHICTVWDVTKVNLSLKRAKKHVMYMDVPIYICVCNIETSLNQNIVAVTFESMKHTMKVYCENSMFCFSF